MAITRTNNLGTITISDLIFAEFVKDGFEEAYCQGKVFPATKRGRQIGNDNKIGINELANNIEIEDSLNGETIDIELNVIIKFGTSIKKVTDTLANFLAVNFEKKYGKMPNQIKIRVVGMKSKQIAKRNIEVIKKYGFEK